MAVTTKQVNPQKLVAQPAVAASAATKTVDLELVTYKRYLRGGTVYETNKAYRFTEEQANILLEEVEESSGRPVWRRYKPKTAPKIEQSVGTKVIVDAQTAKVERIRDADFVELKDALHVGSDDEIADILADVPKGDDDAVTV